MAEAVLKDGARSVRSDTILLVDPTETRKEFSCKWANSSSAKHCRYARGW
ncbi:MAG: hypothetical protein IKF72_04945 [Kiritimatiellae bacterium]|nr:hypothetical protein [Kiritimatiellia bacterium]